MVCPTTKKLENLFYPDVRRIAKTAHALVVGESPWQPASVTVQGIYRKRDERGTIVLDDARVVSLTSWSPSYRPRRKAAAK